MKYLLNLLLGIDQLGNTILGGYPDETISAHAGRRSGAPDWGARLFWTPLDKLLSLIQPNHGAIAIGHEEDGTQQDPAYADLYDPDDDVVKPGGASK